MKKRAFVIHGWGGSPSKDWMPWAKSQLENKGYETTVPVMPDTDEPVIDLWVNKLKKIVGSPQSDDVFIGHSIGCQTILRYLETVSEDTSVNKVILVAPWLTLTNLENEHAWEVADPWLKTPIDFAKLEPKAQTFAAIFSDNDGWVPLKENRAMFEEKLNPKVLVLTNKGHFTEDVGIKEIPEILELL